MAIQIQLRQGTTTEHNTFKGAAGEVTVDTTKDVPVVHDGVTAGGFPVAARANADGTISLIKKDGTSGGMINALGLFNNTLTSTNTNQALTAAQGKVLKDALDTKLDATSAFGVGQTWQNVTASRVVGTTYTNTSGRPIMVSVQGTPQGSTSFQIALRVNDSVVFSDSGWDNNERLPTGVVVMIMNGDSYSVSVNKISMTSWWELR